MATDGKGTLSEAASRALAREALSTSWLSAKLGVEPRQLDAQRRAGDLLAVRPPGATDYLFPAWQFDENGRPLPVVGLLVKAARELGIDEARLYEVLTMRDGLTGRGRLVQAIREGRYEHLLHVIRSAR